MPGPRPTVERRLVAEMIVTMDDGDTILAPGALDLANGRIVAVGRPEELPAVAPEAVEDVGGLLMPGLVDVHAHSPMTLLRGTGEGLPLQRWLTEAIWPREARMTADDVHWGMVLAAAELLRAGVTTTCEMYLWPAELARAAAGAGLRTVVCAPVVEAPGWERFGTWEEQIEAAVELASVFADDPLVEVGIAPHSAYAVPLAALERTAAVAADHDLLLHVHLAETRTEAADAAARFGRSVARLLADLGVFDVPRVLAAHCVWVDDDDLDLLAAGSVAVAHCPQSNAKLASGIAPVTDMLARGITVGLGTDGPASNDNLDLWEEIRLAPQVARLRTLDPRAISAGEALAMATRDAASALGRPDLGVLEAGRRADVVRLDLDDVAFTPMPEPRAVISHLVWSAGSRAVTDVWVAGRRVVAGGRCRTVDLAEARRQVDARARRLAAAGPGG